MTVHPRGLSPEQAAKAWFLRVKQKYKWSQIAKEVVNLEGQQPSENCLRLAVQRLGKKGKSAQPKNNYANCGRRYGNDGGKFKLTPKLEQAVVSFVKQWRHKRFCTCPHIRRELKLDVSDTTVARCLNRHGFFWRAVPKKQPLTSEQLQKRKQFVLEHLDKSPAWWCEHVNLVLDGVTLTKAPASLTGQQKHAAQSISHMWMKKTEKLDNKVHTYNRYGVQYGIKVPLWGGFTGGGEFALRLWTEKPKLTKPEWAKQLRSVKRCLESSEEEPPDGRTKRFKVWQDNERFLQQPAEYRKNGMDIVNWPPNSADLIPIETVWARLRKDLATREFEDLKEGRNLTVQQFKTRAAKILQSYGEVPAGQKHSYLEKLLRGMPQRLKKCKLNKFGRCGK